MLGWLGGLGLDQGVLRNDSVRVRVKVTQVWHRGASYKWTAVEQIRVRVRVRVGVRVGVRVRVRVGVRVR